MKLQEAIKKLIEEHKNQSVNIELTNINDIDCELSSEDYYRQQTNIFKMHQTNNIDLGCEFFVW